MDRNKIKRAYEAVEALSGTERSIDIETQICYTPEQFKNAVMTLKPGKSIVWDESRQDVNIKEDNDGQEQD